jgi:hypothetical protein
MPLTGDPSLGVNPNTAMLAPYLRALPRSEWPAIAAYNAFWRSPAPALNRAGRPIRFVAQEKALHALDYEQRIYDTGLVATRERNWHDLFNALIWTTFPRAKAAINARHYDESQRRAGSGNQRTRVRDALTLLDESGVIVTSDAPDLLDLLRAMKWKELFWQRREEVSARMRFILFGHGLCEQTLRPYIGLTGKALLLAVDRSVLIAEETEQIRALDAQIEAWCDQPAITPNALHPLPLLGVPGWWAANESESFYENRAYFRSKRSRLECTEPARNILL